MSNSSLLLKAQQLTSHIKKNPGKYDFKPATGKANIWSNFRSISQYLSPGGIYHRSIIKWYYQIVKFSKYQYLSSVKIRTVQIRNLSTDLCSATFVNRCYDTKQR